MEKRLPKSPGIPPKSPALYESYKSGCARSLINFFDFRQNSSKKMISSKKHVKKQALDDEKKRKKLINLLINDEKPHESEVQNVKFESECVGDLPKKHLISGKSFKRPQSMPTHGCNDSICKGNVAEMSSKEHRKNSKKNGMREEQLTEVSLRVHMDEAVGGFVNKKSVDDKRVSRDGASKQSKNFVDALGILNSNKELFVNLLQDPNSVLVKHIQELKDSQTGIEETQSSDTIVVLKPSTSSREQSQRRAFVSFEDMKRKLRGAMRMSRKGQNKTSLDEELQRFLCDFQVSEGSKGSGRHVTRNSSGRSYHDIEGMSSSFSDVKREDNVCQVRNVESGIGGKAVSTSDRDHKSLSPSHLKGNVSSMCSSPRKHVSEMLNWRKEAFFREETVTNLGGVSFFSEYDSFVRDWAYGYYSAQLRFSPYGNFPTFYGDKWRDLREKNRFSGSLRKKVEDRLQAKGHTPDEQPQIFNSSSIAENLEIIYSYGDDFSHKDNKTSSSSRHVLNKRGKNGSVEVPFKRDSREVDSYLESQKSDSSGSCQYSLPPLVQKVENCDGEIDEAEEPSAAPIIFSTICEPGASLDQTCTFLDKHQPLSEYIRAILQDSCPDWDKLCAKCQSSHQILDPLSFDSTDTCPDMSLGDHRLIFDYINEVLELHQCYSRCFPWNSLLKSRPRPILSKNMVQEVFKQVDWQLLSQRPQETLQQLMENDLTRSGTWTDVGNDDEDVVAEIVDSFLRDLIAETAISLS